MNLAAQRWRRLRFRVWALRARIGLARAGCRLELVAPDGASFATAPALEPVSHLLGPDRPRGGSLRIELGDWVHLGRHTTIEFDPAGDSVIQLQDGVHLSAGVRLVALGGEIRVGPWARLRDGVTLRSGGRLEIGEHFLLQSYSMVHCAEEVVFEDWVAIAERVTFIDSDHLADGSDTFSQYQPLATDPVRIGSNAWIGANAVFLRGVRLGPNCVVAAGSVLRAGEYPAGWLVAGSPAEAKKPLPAAAKASEVDQQPRA